MNAQALFTKRLLGFFPGEMDGWMDVSYCKTYTRVILHTMPCTAWQKLNMKVNARLTS